MLSPSLALALVAELTDPAQRRVAAQRLARHLGAEDLVIFVPDPELDVLLPAPGFPQTLPHGQQWHAFLAICRTAGEHTAALPFPVSDSMVPAYGIAEGRSVLVLLGGRPRLEEATAIAALLPLLAAAFHEEQAARIAASQAALARHTADEARALATALDGMRRQLQEALVQQTAAIRAREEFLTSMTHDLKSPLTSIKGMAQVLARQMRRAGVPESDPTAASLAMIDGAATKVTAMIDQLLDLALLQAGENLTLDRRPVDLVALVRQVADVHQAEAGGRRIVVEAAVSQLVGDWDAGRLERVVDNLLANAIKYSSDGGDIVARLTEQNHQAGGRAVLQIRDSGLGIPASDLPHIFERFYRGANVVGRVAGTGIGLAGVKQIIEQHDGSITFASQEGRGTTVTVVLPLA